MRVLTVGNMYPPHSHGGYEVLWHSSVEHLRRNGHVVRVLTTDYSKDRATGAGTGDPDVHRELRWYWHDHDFPKISPIAAFGVERHDRAVFHRHLREFRPDAVAWWAMGGMPMSLIEHARAAGVPAVGVIADDWLAYAPLRDLWLTRALRRPWLFGPLGRVAGIPTTIDLGRSARWTFISEHTRERALAAALPDTAIASVARAGVPDTAFTPHTATGWSGRLLYVGRLDPRKGVEHAVRALGELPPGVTLDIVGGGGDDEYEALLEEISGSEGIAGRVRRAGELGRAGVRAAYAAADALVFPVTWPEPWGLVPLEAMACGTPVIATGTGGSGEYLEHERNCLVVEPGSHTAIAAAVGRLTADPALRAQLVAGGLTTARAHTEKRYNNAIMSELEAAVAGSKGG